MSNALITKTEEEGLDFPTKAVGVYLFLFLFVAVFGNIGFTVLNQFILWFGGPVTALIVIKYKYSNLKIAPRELYCYASLLVFAIFGIVSVTYWEGYFRYMQVIVSNLILMTIVSMVATNRKNIWFLFLVIWVSCVLAVFASFMVDERPEAGAASYLHRISGIMGNANGLANYARIGTITGLLLFEKRSKILKVAIIGSLVFFFYTVIQTASRGNFSNILLVYALFLLLRSSVSRSTIIFVVLIGATLYFSYDFLISLFQDTFLYARLTRTENVSQAEQQEARVQLYEIAWQQFRDNPILGVGLNQFRLYSGGKISHTDILDIAVQLGVIAAFIYSLMYISPLIFLIRMFGKLKKMDSSFILLLVFLLSEIVYGFTNANWFNQINMIIIVLILCYVRYARQTIAGQVRYRRRLPAYA